MVAPTWGPSWTGRLPTWKRLPGRGQPDIISLIRLSWHVTQLAENRLTITVSSGLTATLRWQRASDDVVVGKRAGQVAGVTRNGRQGQDVQDTLGARVSSASASTAATARCALVRHPLRPAEASASALLTATVVGTPTIVASHVVTISKENTMATGIVKWFNPDKGFGFIAPDDGTPDVFAHYTQIAGTGHRNLTDGQAVEFDVEVGDRGPAATNIRGI